MTMTIALVLDEEAMNELTLLSALEACRINPAEAETAPATEEESEDEDEFFEDEEEVTPAEGITLHGQAEATDSPEAVRVFDGLLPFLKNVDPEMLPVLNEVCDLLKKREAQISELEEKLNKVKGALE